MKYGITVIDPKGMSAVGQEDNRPFWHRDFMMFNLLLAGLVIGWAMLIYSVVLLING